MLTFKIGLNLKNLARSVLMKNGFFYENKQQYKNGIVRVKIEIDF